MSTAAVLTLPAAAPEAPAASPRSLKRAGLFGLGWSALAQIVTLGIRLASNLILTRLLAPEAYGLLGPALAVLTTLEWLSDLGVMPALVRHPRGAEAGHLQTGWTIGLMRGLGLSAVLALAAWPMAEFARQPALAGVVAVLALRPALMALRSPGLPLLRRRMNFRALFVDEVGQTLVGTLVSLSLAVAFPSVGAVIGGTLAGAVTAVAVSYVLCPVAPRLRWEREAAQDIAGLGRQVLVNTLVMALWLNMDRLLGLRFIDPKAMGLYFVAWNLASVAEGLLTRACDVQFAMLARLTHQREREAWHRRVCRRGSVWGMPLLALGVALGPVAVRVLYDARYAGAAVLFAVLLGRLMMRALGQVQFQYLLACGDLRPATRSYVVALVVQAALLVPLTKLYGVTGLAVCALVSTMALTLCQTWLLHRRSGHGYGDFGWTLGWLALGLGVAFRLG